MKSDPIIDIDFNKKVSCPEQRFQCFHYFQAMHNIDPLMSEFKDTMQKTDALMSKMTELCQLDINVRKTNFYRAKHALNHAEKKKTQIQQLIRRFTEMVLQIVGGRNTSTIEGPHATDWLYALECVDSFNKVRHF